MKIKDTTITAIAEDAATRICNIFGTLDHCRDDIAAAVATAIMIALQREQGEPDL